MNCHETDFTYSEGDATDWLERKAASSDNIQTIESQEPSDQISEIILNELLLTELN